jgi:PadR family transcriptional regulator PadR
MKLLTRAEELVLVAVWRLQKDAYCVPIREHLMELTKHKWSFGSIYDALDRLEKKEYLKSSLSEPLKLRGGRSKRIYRHTKAGLRAMIEIKNVQEKIWDGIPLLAIEREL